MPVSKETPGDDTKRKDKRRAGFRLRRVLLVLLVILILIFSTAVLFHRSLIRAYAPGILNTIAGEFEVYYDLRLTWDGYRVTGLNDFTVTGISIMDIPTGALLLSTDSIRVRTSLFALAIRGRDPISGVTSVELEHPVIALQCEDGRWNTGSLLEPGRGEPYRFPGRLGIIIRDGLIEWGGGELADGVPFPQSRIAGLQGVYRLESNGDIGFRLDGMFSGHEIEPTSITAQAAYNPESYMINISIDASSVDLKLIEPLFDESVLRDVSGLGDTDVSILIGPDAGELGYSILGKATVSNGAFLNDFLDIHATEVNGDLHFSHESVFSSGLTGNVEGATVTVQGHITDFEEEILTANLIIDAENIPASFAGDRLPALETFNPGGSISGTAEVSISSDHVDAVISAKSGTVSISGFSSDLENFLAWYADDIFVVKQMEVNILGGNVIADGVVDFTAEELSYSFHVLGGNLPSEEFFRILPGSSEIETMPAGILSGELNISGRGSELPSVSGVLEADGVILPAFPNLPPVHASVPIIVSGDEINITGACAVTDGAEILAEGVYRLNDGFEGTMAVTVDDPEILHRITGAPIEGMFAISGDIGFSVDAGVGFVGEAYLSDGVLGSLKVPNLSTRIACDSETVRIWDLSGLIGAGAIEGEMTIPLQGSDPGIDTGSFVLQGLNIGSMLPSEYSAAISTTLDITGRVNYRSDSKILTVGLEIIEDAAQLGPNVLSTDEEGISVRIDFPFEDVMDPSLVVSGTLNSRPADAPIYQGRTLTPYSSRVVSEITDLLTGRSMEERGTSEPAIPAVSGAIDIRAELTNLFGKPDGSVDITTGDIVVAGMEFSSSLLHISGADGDSWDIELRVDALDAGSLEITGEIERGETLGDSPLTLSAAVHDSGFNGLLGLLGLSELGTTSGTINGSGFIEGTLTTPVVDTFQLKFGESVAFGVPLSQGEVNFSYDFPMLSISGLEIEGADGFRALGAGAVDLNSVSLTGATLVLRLDDFNLNTISSALDTDLPFMGTVSGTVQLSQDALGPKIHYDASVDEFAWGIGDASLPLGSISLSAEARPGDDQIVINNLELSNNDKSIVVFGKIPADGHDSGADLFDLLITSDTGFSLPMPEGNIDPVVSWKDGLGPVNLSLTGSIAFPVLSGDIDLDFNEVNLYDAILVDSIAGTLHAENSVITTSSELIRVMGRDWNLGLEGNIDLNKLKLYLASYIERENRYIFNAGSIGEIKVAHPSGEPIRINGSGFDFRILPGTDGNTPTITMKGLRDGFSTAVTGDISIVGGQVDIARLPEFSQSDGTTETKDKDISVTFDLHGELLAGFRMQYGNMFNLIVEDADVDLSGNMNYPIVTGSLFAPDGWIDLFGNHFILIEPLEMRLSSLYPPTDPHIKATARRHFREVQSPGFYGEELVITARIDSRLSNMIENIQLTSEPPLGKDQLIAAMAYEDFVFRTIGNAIFGDGAMSSGFEDMDFGGVVLPFATSYLSRYIRREAGFTDFEISMDREQNLLIYLEKEIFDDLVMYYFQKFGPDSEDDYRWGARYRWRPRSWIGFEIDNDEEITPQIEYIIPLD